MTMPAAAPLEEPRTSKRRPARARNMVLATIVGAAFVGYFVGLGGGTPRPDGTGRALRPEAAAPGTRTAPPAMTYAEVGQRPVTVNAASTDSWSMRVTDLHPAPGAKPVLL